MLVLGEIGIYLVMIVAIAVAASMTVWLVVASLRERLALRKATGTAPGATVPATWAGARAQSSARQSHLPASQTRA